METHLCPEGLRGRPAICLRTAGSDSDKQRTVKITTCTGPPTPPKGLSAFKLHRLELLGDTLREFLKGYYMYQVTSACILLRDPA